MFCRWNLIEIFCTKHTLFTAAHRLYFTDDSSRSKSHMIPRVQPLIDSLHKRAGACFLHSEKIKKQTSNICLCLMASPGGAVGQLLDKRWLMAWFSRLELLFTYHQISWSLEAVRFDVSMTRSLWKLTQHHDRLVISINFQSDRRNQNLYLAYSRFR